MVKYEQPSTTGLDGRGTNGRFLPGNRVGRGNPFGGKVAKLRAGLIRCAKIGDVTAVVKALLSKAKAGDVAAAKLFLSYTIGEPVAYDLVERFERIEAALGALEQ